MGHILKNIKTLFDKTSFFYENSDAFSVRFDYFSQPDFIQRFFEKLRPLFNSFFEAALPLSFRLEVPNQFMLRMMNIDSVAQILNTTIGQISKEPIYVYEDKILTFIDRNLLNQKSFGSLMIGKNYCCLYLGNSIIPDLIRNFLDGLYGIIKDLEKKGYISLVNMELLISGRIITNEKGYNNNVLIGNYTPISPEYCTSMVQNYLLERPNLKMSLLNILRITDVETESEGLLKDMREQRLTLKIDRKLNDNNKMDFNSMLNEMLDSGIKFMNVCVR